MSGAALDFYNPTFNKTRSVHYPLTTAAYAGTTDAQTIRIPGEMRSGLVGVRIDGLACDLGKRAAGAAIATVLFKLVPTSQPGLFGGSTYLPFAVLDGFQQNTYRWESCILHPGEAIDLTAVGGTAAAVLDFVLFRTFLYQL